MAELPRFVKAIIHADLWVCFRVATPAACWIDYRFHINRFDQAATCLSAGLAMNVAANFGGFLRMPKMGWLGIIGSVLLVSAYVSWLKMLNIASRKYEQRPDILSFEAKFFMVLIFPPLRLFMLLLGSLLEATSLPVVFVAPTGVALVHLLTDWWMVLMGAGLYLAGTLPPQRPRREKKGWAWQREHAATTPA